jgi:hypothetical protein
VISLIGYINMQNNHYRSSQNPLTYAVPLQGVKVGVWCVVNARRIVALELFNETIAKYMYGWFLD